MVTEKGTARDRHRQLGLHQEDSAALHIAGQGSAGFSQGALEDGRALRLGPVLQQ